MRPLFILTILILVPVSAASQCEGDLRWNFDDGEDEGFSIGSMFSNAVTPQIVTDTRAVRLYVRDPRFRELTLRCGDMRAVDAIYQKALRLADYSVGRGLLIAMMAVLEHQQIHVRMPIVKSMELPVTLEDDSMFVQRVRHLPRAIYHDTPSGDHGDKDKLQHFFGSAYLAYASESTDIARGAGNVVEWGEAKFVVGGADDPRDKRANKQGEAFGRDLLVVKNLLPSDYLVLPVREE
ncbi:MAG: hypothetical protein MUE68_04370 [Bacteroidetes bacterium]|jgi:hypothetical protein|nr:hypothetical protein [Bacteroidota bacterium]